MYIDTYVYNSLTVHIINISNPLKSGVVTFIGAVTLLFIGAVLLLFVGVVTSFVEAVTSFIGGGS